MSGMLDREGARFIRDANAGLVASAGDSKALAVSVREMMLKSEEELKKKGSSARSYTQKEFDCDVLFSSLEKLFEEAIQLHRATN